MILIKMMIMIVDEVVVMIVAEGDHHGHTLVHDHDLEMTVVVGIDTAIIIKSTKRRRRALGIVMMMIEATVEVVAAVQVQVIHHPPAGLDHVIKRIERSRLRNIIVHPRILKRGRNIIIINVVVTRRVRGTRRNHHLIVKGIMIKNNIMMMNRILHLLCQIMHVKY